MKRLLLPLLLCSCVDTRASYRMYDSDMETIPRAFDSNKQPVGRLATMDELKSVALYCHLRWPALEDECKDGVVYLTKDVTLSVLCHEVTHSGQFKSGMTRGLGQEAGAMQIEVRALMYQGWSDDQIKSLSRNNSQTKMLAQIHTIQMTDPVRDAYLFGLTTNQLPQ